MSLLPLSTILGRAAIVRHKADYLDADPPYSTRRIIEAAFPDVVVAGAEGMPKGVIEMAEVSGKRRVLWYNRRVPPATQRVGVAHGLHHFLTDLKQADGILECNVPLRTLEQREVLTASPTERAADLFGGELLVPFDVLDRYVPATMWPTEHHQREAWNDLVDQLASTFNVPAGFMRWRLYDLGYLRKTHFFCK